MVDSFNRLTGF